MSLRPGQRLGGYEILGVLGAGGMGEVYRARDSHLGRDIAVKVLPEAVAGDPERLARFGREARALAALSHPNIAHVYDLEAGSWLVMELVHGDDLSARIASGPIPFADALPFALQIADALDAAHEHGIVHRDLKPANIKVTPDGVIKILDFGLAKLHDRQEVEAADAAESPTLTASVTELGVVLGTAAYMAPEQARGRPVDKRADIWAFGVVLFEMLAGRRPFGGRDVTEVLAQILEREPDWSLLPASVPPAVTRILSRCLAKNPKRRARDIGDVRAELEDARASDAAAPAASRRTRWPIVAAGLLFGLAAGAGLVFQLTRAEPGPAARLSIPFLQQPVRMPFGTRNLAISDDGALIAYASSGRLWLRRMNEGEAVAIGPGGSDPFFSPDGRSVAVFNENGRGIFKVPIDGGPPSQLVSTTERAAGGAWSSDGTIVFATTEGLFRVSDHGGTPELLAAPNRDRRERLYAWPQLLPGGRAVLFTIIAEDASTPSQVAVLELSSRRITSVVTGGTGARYLPDGQLIFAMGSKLKVARFDAGSRTIRGESVLVPNVDVASSPDNGAANFDVSPVGTLIFTSPDTLATVGAATLVWIDRHGNREPIALAPGIYGYPRVSPDGTRVAIDVRANANRDIWLLDLARLSLTQLTDGPSEDMLPEWSYDGRRIFFASDRRGTFDVYSQAADGASPPKLEFGGEGLQVPGAVVPDGTGLVVYDRFQDLVLVPFANPGAAVPLLQGKADKRVSNLSPDGRWMVYESDESGSTFEIFLRPFPNVADSRVKVSVAGGRFPHWSADGKEIFYVNPNGDMMAAAVETSPVLKLTSVTALFSWRKPPPGRSGLPYDVSRKDGRFLTTELADTSSDKPTQVSVILNWTTELRRLLAGAR